MSNIVTQADRDEAAKFARQAWHLFWPNDYDRAIQDADEIATGRNDNWHLVQAFARHRAAVTASLLEDMRKPPTTEMLSAGVDAFRKHVNAGAVWQAMLAAYKAHPITPKGEEA